MVSRVIPVDSFDLVIFGGTGDLVTGLATAFLCAGASMGEACTAAARVARLLAQRGRGVGAKARPVEKAAPAAPKAAAAAPKSVAPKAAAKKPAKKAAAKKDDAAAE